MGVDPIVEYLEREIARQTVLVRGIMGGDRWTQWREGSESDVTEQTLADARHKLEEAEKHLERLNAKP